MSEQEVPVVGKQLVVPLSGGWYMVRHVTKEMCDHMWNLMDENQRGEVRALYGSDDEVAKEGLWRECEESGHQAAFFDSQTLVCIMWAEWTPVYGVGRLRVLGCFCNSEYAALRPLAFVKKTPECRDAFELEEPPDVSELHVFIAKDYEKSKKWAVMFGGMKKAFDAKFGKHLFVCFSRKIGGQDV